MQAFTTIERHPVRDPGTIVGLTVSVVVKAHKLHGGGLHIDEEYARIGTTAIDGIARDAIAFPNHVVCIIVHANVLLRKVYVHIAVWPVLAARRPARSGSEHGDLYGISLVCAEVVCDGLRKRAAVNTPSIVIFCSATLDGDLFAVGTSERARLADGVELLRKRSVRPFLNGILIYADVYIAVEGKPARHEILVDGRLSGSASDMKLNGFVYQAV